MGFSEQFNFHPTIYVSARSRVDMLPLCLEASGYVCISSLCIHAKEVFHIEDKWGVLTTLPEASFQVLTLFLLLFHQEALLCQLFLLIEGVSVPDTHVVNNVCPSLPEVADQQISHLLIHIFCRRWIFRKGPLKLGLDFPRGAN